MIRLQDDAPKGRDTKELDRNRGTPMANGCSESSTEHVVHRTVKANSHISKHSSKGLRSLICFST